MKKILAIFMVMTMILAFASCGDKKSNSSKSDSKAPEHTTMAEQPPLNGEPVLKSNDSQMVFLVDNEYRIYTISGGSISSLCGYMKCDSVKKAQDTAKFFRETVLGKVGNIDGINTQDKYVVKYYNPSEYQGKTIEEIRKTYADKEVK